jgi:lipid II isoglutaminyl synthase (glutamine-hydrolysing)
VTPTGQPAEPGAAWRRSGRDSALAIAVVYPDLLGTYGDGGNGIILARRAAWRGIEVDLIQATSGRPLPTADIYCIGGGEDGPQVRAAEALRADGAVGRAVEQGAVALGVCAGYQLLGRTFPDSSEAPHVGLELLDVTTVKGSGRRAVGEVVARPDADGPRLPSGAPLPVLTGFENHSAVTAVGPGSAPVGQVVRGVGNGDGTKSEGAWRGRVFGSYLHGPVLARNAGLADLLLGWALGVGASVLEPLDDGEESALRAERLASVDDSSPDRMLQRTARRIRAVVGGA